MIHIITDSAADFEPQELQELQPHLLQPQEVPPTLPQPQPQPQPPVL